MIYSYLQLECKIHSAKNNIQKENFLLNLIHDCNLSAQIIIIIIIVMEGDISPVKLLMGSLDEQIIIGSIGGYRPGTHNCFITRK